MARQTVGGFDSDHLPVALSIHIFEFRKGHEGTRSGGRSGAGTATPLRSDLAVDLHFHFGWMRTRPNSARTSSLHHLHLKYEIRRLP